MKNNHIVLKRNYTGFITGLTILFLACFFTELQATHIVGGDITYSCISTGKYEVTFTMRRDCFLGEDDAPFDDPISIGVFDKFGNRLSYLGNFGQFLIPFTQDDTLNNVLLSDCAIIGSPVCVHEAVYKDTLYLPYLEGGYFLAYQRCCRNQSLLNIQNPLETGSSYYIRITDEAQNSCNSSPVFNNWGDIYICAEQELIFDHSATDAEGDSLVYKLNRPNSGATFDEPMPQPPDNPPYDFVDWQSPFGLNNMMGGVPLQIDPTTGIMTARPNFVGQYLIGVRVEEYRNGELLSIVRRDFEYNVRVCGIAPEAALDVGEFECGELEVPFVNQSQNAELYRWYFDYPNTDPAFLSSEEHPTFSFPDFGTYKIRLEAIRALDGCRTIDEIDLVLSPSQLNVDFSLEVDSCLVDGYVIRLTDLSTDPEPGNEIISQLWTVINGVDTLIGTGSPVQFAVQNTDTVEVNLMVTSSRFCTGNLTQMTEIVGINDVDFKYEVLECDDDSILVQFTEETMGSTSSSWNWTVYMEDIAYGATGNPAQIVLPGLGSYHLSLITELLNGCQGLAEDDIDIALDYAANFDFQLIECSENGFLVQFNDASENIPEGIEIEQVSWVISGEGQLYNGTGENIEFLIETEGFYQVDMMVELSNGCAFSSSNDFDLNLNEIFPIGLDYVVTKCNEFGLFVNLTADASQLPDYVTANAWSWNVSGQGVNVNLAGINPSLTLPSPGVYAIELIAALSNKCEITFIQDFEIGLNDYDIDFTYEITGCEEGTIQVQFFADAGSIPAELGPNEWNWSIEYENVVVTLSGESPEVVLPSGGIYHVTLSTDLNNGCSTEIAEDIDIQTENYGIGFTYLISDCDNGELILNLTANEGNIPSHLSPSIWQWIIIGQFDTIETTGLNPTISLSTDGEFLIRLTAILADGCPATYVEDISLELPRYNTSISYEFLDCRAGDIIVQLHANTGDIPQELLPTDWHWYITGITGTVEATGTNPQVQLEGAGTYTIELIAILANECPSSNTLELIVELEEYDFSFDYDFIGCDGSQFILTLNPDDVNIPPNLLPVSWEWIIQGNGINIQVFEDNPQVILPGPGDYTVTLTAILSDGCPSTKEISFSVQAENYSIGVNNEHLSCMDESLNVILSPEYSGLPAGLIATSWSWNVSNGLENLTSNDEYPNFDIAGVGPYSVTLNVILSNGCTASFNDEIEIVPNQYVAGFDAEVTGCNEQELALSLTGNIDLVPDPLTAISWAWFITSPDVELTSTGVNTAVTLPQAGVYTIRLDVLLSNGCTASVEEEFNANALSYVAGFDFEIISCDGEIIDAIFHGNIDDVPGDLTAVDWHWTFSIGDSNTWDDSGQDPQVELMSSNYSVLLEVTLSNGCIALIDSLVSIDNSIFDAEFEYEIIGCFGDGLRLNLISQSDNYPGGMTAVGWSWLIMNADNSVSVSGEMPFVVLTTQGEYTVYLEVLLSNGCLASIEKTILFEAPEYLVDFNYNFSGCQEDGGIKIQLESIEDNLPGGFTIVNWIWILFNMDGSQILVGENPEVMLDQLGLYTVELQASLSNGCQAKISREIIVEMPNYLASFAIESFGCEEENPAITLLGKVENLAAGDNVIEWEWLVFNDTDSLTASGNNPTIGLIDNGVYTIELLAILDNGCQIFFSDDIDIQSLEYSIGYSYEVTDCDPDGIKINLSANTGNIPDDTDITSWNWEIVTPGGNILAEGLNVEVVLPGEGTFTINITVVLANGCTASLSEDFDFDSGFDADFDFEVISCEGDNVNFLFLDNSNDLNPGLDATDWQWTFTYNENIIEMNGQQVLISIPEGVNLHILLEILLDNGCPANFEEILPVSLDLMAGFEHEILDCEEDSINIKLWDTSIPNALGLSPSQFLWTIILKDEVIEMMGDTIQLVVDSSNFMIVNHTVIFENGCSANIEESINFNFPVISFFADSIAKCGLNPVALINNPNPNWVYTWTPTEGLDFGQPPDFSNPLANPDTTTTYSLMISNGSCSDTGEVTVVVGDNIDLFVSGDTNTCQDEEIRLDVNGAGAGAIYMWSDDISFNNILSSEDSLIVSVSEGSQTYYVTSEAIGLCAVGVDSLTVTNQSINFDLSGEMGICLGDTIDIALSSADSVQNIDILWASDPHIISDLDSNIIQVIAFDSDDTIRLSYVATNQFGCELSNQINIPLGDREETPLFLIVAQECGSLTVCFEAMTDNGEIKWDFGDPNSEADTSSLSSVCYEYSNYGNYNVSLNSSSSFCGFAMQSMDLEVGPVLDIELVSDSIGYCEGDQINLSVMSNVENIDLIWYDSQGVEIGQGDTLPYTGAGNQILTVIAAGNACADTATIYLDDYEFNVDPMPVDLLCSGQETQIFINNNTQDSLIFSWEPTECIVSGGDTNAPTISVENSKNLIANITNVINGCMTQIVVPIEIIEYDVIIDAVPGQEINLGASVELEVNGAVPSDDYMWSTGESDPVITVMPTDTTTYYVTVTNDNGCQAIDSITISVRQPVCNEEDVFLPSAFSPNGDNINDVLFLRSNFVLLMELIIYDRWGEEIFISRDINVGWNGRYKNNGEELPPDAYAYSLKVTCINDFNYIVAGNVSLLR